MGQPCTADDLAADIAFGQTVPGVPGLPAVAGGRMAAWGELEVVPLGRTRAMPKLPKMS
jgi:hypothetical protein